MIHGNFAQVALILFVFTVSGAYGASRPAAVPCKGKALQAAMAEYLSVGAIQGDDPIPSYVRASSAVRGRITHEIEVEGSNDEGESWVVTFRVKTGTDAACRVYSVTQVD